MLLNQLKKLKVDSWHPKKENENKKAWGWNEIEGHVGLDLHGFTKCTMAEVRRWKGG